MDLSLPELTAVLSRTPATLRALLGDLPPAWIDTREGEGTFSPRDVVGHLIHGEKTDWMPRVRLILESGESRPFVPFDRVGFREAIAGRSIGDLLGELQSLRDANLRALQNLAITPEQLELRGRHPELGSVTLGQLLATWAVHDLNHVDQVVRVMSKRYASAVGPWRAYLGILNR
jgi:DinB superfamily